MSDLKRNDAFRRFLGSVRDIRADCAWLEIAQEDLAQRMDRLRKQHDLLMESEKKVGELLERVPDEVQRTVLRLRYLQLLSWPEIQDKLEEKNCYYSIRNIYNIHHQALETARHLWADEEGSE